MDVEKDEPASCANPRPARSMSFLHVILPSNLSWRSII
jgi:hypothetical protein